MDFNKRAGQLEWMSISHEQMVQFICGKYDKKTTCLGYFVFYRDAHDNLSLSF